MLHRLASAQSGGQDVLFCLGVLRLCRGSADINAILPGDIALLACDLREERRESVVILLTPFFKGMMVAASTLDAQTEKQLGRILKLRTLVFHFSRYQATGGFLPTSPDAVRISRTNSSYGLF